MDNADEKRDALRQPASAVIDRLSFTIQRQSAMCMEFVQYAVEAEREQCAKIAEAEARNWNAPADQPVRQAAARIAEKIRARAEEAPLVAAVVVDAAG